MANSSLQPNLFDGTGDIDEFCNSFNQYDQFANWAECTKINALQTMQKDNSVRWLMRQNILENITYADLQTLICQKYESTTSQRFRLHFKLVKVKKKGL